MNELKIGNSRKLFSRIYIGVFSSVCDPCHDRISANFSETNFVEVPNIHEICEICSPQERCPIVGSPYMGS